MALNSALVTDGWINGFAREPGRNVDYRAGRCLMQGGTRHQTVGRCAGDRSVGLRGIFQAYVPRSKDCSPGWTQFAQLDAVCFHNCEWNDELTGCEVEWLTGETFTDYQIDGCGLWVAALISVGITDADRSKPGLARFPIGTNIDGFVDHGDLEHVACDQHTDGWAAHWPAIHAAALRHLGHKPQEDTLHIVSVSDGPNKYQNYVIDSFVDNDGNRDIGIWHVAPDKGSAATFGCAPSLLSAVNSGVRYEIKPSSATSGLRTAPDPSTFGTGGAGPAIPAIPADWLEQVEDAAFRGAQRAEKE